jgi:hypothetical protein
MSRAYVIGVVYVAFASVVAVALRAFAEAAFLGAFGVARLPWFLVAAASSFGAATLLYDSVARRVRAGLLDPALFLVLALACALGPWARARGGAPLFALALALIGLSSVAALAAWNRLASTVSGRDARRLLPRAGAAVTAGGVTAGFGAGAVVAWLGLSRLTLVALPLLMAMLVCDVALGRRAGTVRAAPAAPRSRLAGDARGLVAWLAVAALLEAAAATLIEFRFNATLKAVYPGEQLGVAIAVFYGVTNAVLLLLQLLAVPRVLVTRSVPFTASLHPLLLLFAVAAVLGAPGLITIAGARTLDGILRNATSRTSQEVSLSVLAPAERERWKLLLRGLVTPLGAALAAGTLVVGGAGLWSRRIVAAVPVLAFFWVVAVRRAARAFLASLTAPLGMREVALREARRKTVGLDEIVALLEKAGDPDPRTSELARTLLDRVGFRADELSPHLDHDDARVRAALFAMAARAPHPHAAGDLRAAVAVERDPDALAAGLRALAAHGDPSAAERARDMARLSRRFEPLARAYLAELGLADRDETLAAIRHALDEDGVWAASIARAALERHTVDEAALDELPAGPATWAFTAALGGSGLGRWLDALAGDDAGAPRAARTLSDAAAAGLVELHAAGHGSARAWERLAGALHTASARPVLLALLADDRPGVRLRAARSLARLCREGRATVARAEVARPLERELDELAARLDDDGLERALAMAALQSDPGPLRAAERRLRSTVEAERRRALDVLQELSRSQPRLLDLVEAYLKRSSARPIERNASAK